ICIDAKLQSRQKVNAMSQLITRLLHEESGQDLIEYALLAAFISLTSTLFITNVGTRVNLWYQGYGATIATIPTGGS
ncbi:MAG: Flp family type IVb pilin, partial [Vicinamibacterales bacterium]